MSRRHHRDIDSKLEVLWPESIEAALALGPRSHDDPAKRTPPTLITRREVPGQVNRARIWDGRSPRRNLPSEPYGAYDQQRGGHRPYR